MATCKSSPNRWQTRWGQLKLLDLSRNAFDRIPSSVSRLTTLETLSLGCNRCLELRFKDLRVLRALPNLVCLDVSQNLEDGRQNSGLSQSSVGVLIETASRLPKLVLSGFVCDTDDEVSDDDD